MGVINLILGIVLTVMAIPCLITYLFRCVSIFFKMLTIFGKDPDEVALRTGRVIFWEAGLIVLFLIVGELLAVVILSLVAFLFKIFKEEGMDRVRNYGYSFNKLGKPLTAWVIYIALLVAKSFIVFLVYSALTALNGDMSETVDTLTSSGPLGGFIPSELRLLIPIAIMGVIFYMVKFTTSRDRAVERRAQDRAAGRRKAEGENKGYKADASRGKADTATGGGGREEW